ncbi:hypothetical protein [Actinomadura nitritigenes]|uniref:hypothetical protein n=1 Tax=Actinomadura nitritigenes TaxID=134602 RepID=UPI003D8FB9DA
METIGRLEPVALRAVWPNEASAFTPWLANNLDVLGQAVGLALVLKEREHPVGRYSLDLLVEDAQGRVVAVENQLEQTDHAHLGQLLTYCAGTQAQIVIWIAQSITNEHAAALEWLNDNTIEGVGFFGVQVEALRIGDSLPAANFQVIVRPNDVTKASRQASIKRSNWTWEAYADELRLPLERIEVGRFLAEAIADAVEERGLAWQMVMNKGYVAFQRPGSYNVLIIDLWVKRVPRLAAKVPGSPSEHGLVNPFPQLEDSWDGDNREWGWTIPPGTEIPDLSPLLDLIQPLQPATGPMQAGEPSEPNQLPEHAAIPAILAQGTTDDRSRTNGTVSTSDTL